MSAVACAHLEQHSRGDRYGDEEIPTIPEDLYAVRPHGVMVGRASLV
jgi:hypothetical protein